MSDPLPTWAELREGLEGFETSFGGEFGMNAVWRHPSGFWREVKSRTIEGLKRSVLEGRIRDGTWPVVKQEQPPNPEPKPLATPAQPKKNPYERKFG